MPAYSLEKGFSLLEAFVALAILSLSLGVIYQSQVHSVRAVDRGISVQGAVLQAQTLLAEQTGPQPAMAQEGVFADGMHWRFDTRAVELPPLMPGWQPVAMRHVDLILTRSMGARLSEVRISTLDAQ